MSGTTPSRSSTARQERKGLGPGLIAFIVLDVLLVVWAIWLGVSMASDSETPSADPEPAATSPAPAPTGSAAPEPQDEATGAKTVASPSGNIACEVSPTGARCAAGSLAAEPAPVDGCDGTVGYVAEVTSAGVSVPCIEAGDQPIEGESSASVLDYGDSVTVNNFTCESSEAGMRCTDTSTGKGFNLARAGIEQF